MIATELRVQDLNGIFLEKWEDQLESKKIIDDKFCLIKQYQELITFQVLATLLRQQYTIINLNQKQLLFMIL